MLHDYAKQLPGGVTLVPGSGGIFEVTLGERTLFSKEQEDRFPNENEVEDALEAALDA